ncbi:MAG: NAD-dependent epimerase/dehydratase family protein [Verrucomicrobia bacterium]|nr:NAD-dependent epimerase/dehydratase family protein [Verrucomicrobiota bacterium]
MTQKRALVCGAGGFIAYHLVKRLKDEGYWVRGADIKEPLFGATHADDFLVADLTQVENAIKALALPDNEPFDEVYQLAANMGGMGFISTHASEIMRDSSLINLHILEQARKTGAKKILFTSSACIYPEHNQKDPENPKCAEETAYPAAPDTEYGWEKIYAERLYQAFAKDYGMDTRVVRLHNVFGPLGTWQGGREKAPAALCRKVAEAQDGGTVEVWGRGDQTRSFLYIDECIEGIRRVMNGPAGLPVLNLGSEENIPINELTQMIAEIANKRIEIKNVEGPEGVRGRTSDNFLLQEKLGWQPSQSLKDGLKKLYPWIQQQVALRAIARGLFVNRQTTPQK